MVEEASHYYGRMGMCLLGQEFKDDEDFRVNTAGYAETQFTPHWAQAAPAAEGMRPTVNHENTK